MFSFFDNQQNPLMGMMRAENRAQNDGAGSMSFMQQAWMMQMQFMQNMCMMPLYMMQGFTSMLGQFIGGMAPEAAPERAAAGQAGGFKIGDMELPPELLGTLLNLEMSPENLEKLQKTLDFVFGAMPKANNSNMH